MPDSFRLKPQYNEETEPTIGTFSDGTLFSDGTGFSEGVVPPFIGVEEAAAAGSKFIKVNGLPESISGIFKPGDLIEVLPNGQQTEFGHLYEVVQQANSDADGKSGFEIRPRLRAAIAAGDQIKTLNPSSVFRLAGDQEGIVNRAIPDIGRLGLTLVEKLPQ